MLDQQIDTTTPGGRLVFHMMGAVAQFEAALIRERTMDGLAAARARGRTGGRKPKLNERQAAVLREMYESRKHTVREIGETFGISEMSVYRYLRQDPAAKAG